MNMLRNPRDQARHPWIRSICERVASEDAQRLEAQILAGCSMCSEPVVFQGLPKDDVTIKVSGGMMQGDLSPITYEVLCGACYDKRNGGQV